VNLKIIHQTKDFFVIDKPAGLVVDRSSSSKKIITLQDKLEENFSELKRQSGEFGERSGLVHRLDKDTSGLLLVAKNELAFEKLKELFQKRKIKKEYLALAHGRLEPSKGEINFPLARSRFDRRKFGISLDGKKAKTDYEVIGFFVLNKDNKLKKGDESGVKTKEVFSFCRVFPLTGRTHQIRIHLKQLGFPLAADEKYAGRKTSKKDSKWCPRQFLHAHKLRFKSPFNDQILEFASPLPEELGSLFEKKLLR